MTFGQRFKRLRVERGLKQQELVDDFNKIYGHSFSKSSISQYENDKKKPDIEALKHFALYFGVSVDYLLGLDNLKDSDKQPKEVLQNNFLSAVTVFFENESISRAKKDRMFKQLSKIYFNSLK